MNPQSNTRGPIDRGRWAGLGASVLLVACSAEPPADTPIPAVYVTEVRHDVSGQRHAFSGVVAARVETELGFRVGGQLAERHVAVGDRVRRGQPLARLDTDDLRLAEQAAAQQVQAARVDARQSASDAARFERLLVDGSIGAADAERQAARADAAAARLLQAQAQWALARNRLGQTTLIAPYDGVITAIRAEPGQVVAEGTPVMAMARSGDTDVLVDIPEQLATQVTQWRAQARLAADPGAPSLPLTVREVAPAASSTTRTVRVRYRVPTEAPSAASGWTLGRSLEVSLQREGTGPSSASLPLTAIVSTDGRPSVWLVNAHDGTLKRQAVNTLDQDTQTVRVQGLPPGALVVSVGAHKLDEAQRVRPVVRTPLAARSGAGGTTP